MTETFAALLFAHVLADFLFQTNWMVANKRQVLPLAAHVGVVLVTAIAATGTLHPALFALALAHLGIDLVKTHAGVKGLAPFLLDQAAHLATLAADARKLFEAKLVELKARHGDKLVVSSGATMEGVPKIVYEVCEAHGIAAMGVTSEKAANYRLGKMQYLVIEGKDWGDESRTFIQSSDEIVMIGGGGQAKREAIAAATEGTPVTIFQGYGGTADQILPADAPGATFLARH